MAGAGGPGGGGGGVPLTPAMPCPSGEEPFTPSPSRANPSAPITAPSASNPLNSAENARTPALLTLTPCTPKALSARPNSACPSPVFSTFRVSVSSSEVSEVCFLAVFSLPSRRFLSFLPLPLPSSSSFFASALPRSTRPKRANAPMQAAAARMKRRRVLGLPPDGSGSCSSGTLAGPAVSSSRSLVIAHSPPPARLHTVPRSLTLFSGQFTCRHHAASAAAAGLLSYSTGLRSPIEV